VCRLNLGEAGAYIHEGECYPARILAEHNTSASQDEYRFCEEVFLFLAEFSLKGICLNDLPEDDAKT
jgi:hypothetical protein